MAEQQKIIKKFVDSLDKTTLKGTAAVDEAIKACSNFTSYNDLMNHFLADRKASANGEEFLKTYCGINLDNEDTGTITGFDAGGNVIKTAESVVPENFIGKSVYPPNNSFSYKGLTINVPDKSTLTEAQQNIVAGLYTWWLKAGLDLVEETYDLSFEDSDATFKTITLTFDMEGHNTWDTYWNYLHYSDGHSTDLSWHINSDKYKNLTNEDCNGNRVNGICYLDRIIAGGLSGALMIAKTNYTNLPGIVTDGLYEILDGIDDVAKNSITGLVNDTENLSKNLSTNENRNTGYILMRYLAKQAAKQSGVETEINIPEDAFEYNGHSYYLYSEVTNTWEQAQKYCENLGGYLAIIKDVAENTALFNYMKSQGYDSAYFGLSDTAQEGKWTWADGTSLTYTNWASGEPNGNQYENYGMFYKTFTDGKWNDGNFNKGSSKRDTNTFICEWDNLREEEIEIDSSTTLEVINLFAGLSIAEKKSALKENLESLQKIKTLIEGDKKIEIVDEETSNIFYTDSKNLFDCINAYYDDDAAPIITEYTNYIHDSKGRIVYKRKYKRDSAGNIMRDANNQPIREFKLDANGNKIKIENQSEYRKFMGNMLGYVTDFYSIYGSLEKINSGNLNGVEKTAEISKLSGSVVSLIGNIREIGDFDKAGTIAPVASALLGLTGSIISLCDGVKAEEIVDVVQETLKSSLIISKYALQPEFASTKIGHLLGGNSFVTTKIKPLAETLNANALKANLGVAVALRLVMGGVQYFKSNEQYQIDGLKDSLALKDKWTDAFSAGMKTFYSTVTLGLDDVVFGFASNLVYLGECFGTWITGGDVSKVQKMSTGGKKYMELFGDFVKLVFFNQYTDAEGDNGGYMENTKAGRNIYSGGGNDSINNKASKVNIYSGIGNDLIFCTEGTNQQYIDGGNDNDKIALYGSSNEIHGGLGDDEITIFGDNKNPAAGNYILGEAGNDYIWLGDSKSKKNSNVANTIDGGEGDDIIFIDLTKTSNTILYKNGDGDDSIYGYDSNDKIIINKSDYTSITSGDDIKISIGDGSITLFDAKDKKINI